MIKITDMFYIDTRLVRLAGTSNVFKSLNYGDKDFLYIYKDTEGKHVAVWDLAVKEPGVDYEQVTITRLNKMGFDIDANKLFATYTYNLFGEEYWKEKYKSAVFDYTCHGKGSDDFHDYMVKVVLPLDNFIRNKVICPIQSTIVTTDLEGYPISAFNVDIGNCAVCVERFCMVGFTVLDIFSENMFIDVFEFIDIVRIIKPESAILIESSTDERINTAYKYNLKERFNLV